MKPPFIWFGGKRRVAPQVWDALGDVKHYLEPFAGSLAVLLGRPHDLNDGNQRAETVNDADGFISNFWRGVAYDPEAVAFNADWHVDELDLTARHIYLTNVKKTLITSLESDPEWFDPKIAGWWVWGINAWIGSGWCAGKGPWNLKEGTIHKYPRKREVEGITRQRPHLGDYGRGINAKNTDGIYSYIFDLHARLRQVRVCCGNWERIMKPAVLNWTKPVGIFLDPPYHGDVRQTNLYAADDHTISDDVRKWCLDNANNPNYRIVLAGYSDEHDNSMPDNWTRKHWSSSTAYQSMKNDGRNNENRHKEMLWFSPHCLNSSLW